MVNCLNTRIDTRNIIDVSKVLIDRKNLDTLKGKFKDKTTNDIIKDLLNGMIPEYCDIHSILSRKIKKFITLSFYIDKESYKFDRVESALLLSVSSNMDIQETMNGYIVTLSVADLINIIKAEVTSASVTQMIQYANSLVPSGIFNEDDIIEGAKHLYFKYDYVEAEHQFLSALTSRFSTIGTTIDVSDKFKDIIDIAGLKSDLVLKALKVNIMVNDMSLIPDFARFRNIELLEPINIYMHRLTPESGLIELRDIEGLNADGKQVKTLKLTTKSFMMVLDQIEKSGAVTKFNKIPIRSMTYTGFIVSISLFDLFQMSISHHNEEIREDIQEFIDHAMLPSIVGRLTSFNENDQ